MIRNLHPVNRWQKPDQITYDCIEQARLRAGTPSAAALVVPDFMRIPLHVQAECRLRSYRDHLPEDLDSEDRLGSFHYYSAQSRQVLGVFGNVPVHNDRQKGQRRRLTCGLILVNDGASELVMGDLQESAESSEGCAWPLPVGSLYIMDSVRDHCTHGRDKRSLFSFLALDFEADEIVQPAQLKAGMRDTLRMVFGYETDKIRHVWQDDPGAESLPPDRAPFNMGAVNGGGQR